MKRRLLILIIAAALGVGVAALSTMVLRSMQPEKPQVLSGKALIGGTFTLTDHTGRRVSEKDFAGRFMLIYFGYTFCPDVCPAELQVMSAALDQLGDKAKNVTPVFITIDPERDTVKQMASYVTNFHERMVGLTGTAEEIRAAAKAYRVYYAKAEDDTSSTDYMMEHSSIVFLMSPKGEYLAHFTYGTGVDKMATGIAKFL
ncbi:MAG TPA: SCO family protein [Rhizobiales bacterium]|nr:SCO family protein [Hyphomicrobiales bacterium]